MNQEDRPPSPWLEEFRRLSGKVRAPGGPPPQSGESRRHLRFLIWNAVAQVARRRRVTLWGLLGKSISGAVLDLSEGGACLSIATDLPVEATVGLRIEIAKFQDLISCEGEVRWCQSDPANPSGYQVGIMFLGLDPSVEKKIGRMRDWFTSAYCTENREGKPSSQGRIPVPPRPDAPPEAEGGSS